MCSQLSKKFGGNKALRGFTLVEIIVVLTIIAILGVIAFANYGSFKKDQNLKSAASNLQTLVRLAQSNATARIKCGGDISGSGANWVASFNINKTTVNLNCRIDLNPPVVENDVVPPLVLINNITVDTITGDLGCSASFPVTVTYSPLYGGVSFSDPGVPGCNNSSKLNINLKDSEGKIKTVIINKGGSVDVQ